MLTEWPALTEVARTKKFANVEKFRREFFVKWSEVAFEMNQDKIWDHFQNSDLADVCFPKERQRYVAKLLKSGWRVLNVGVGSGELEKLGVERGIDMYSLDPSEGAICRLKERLGLGSKAKTGYAQDMPFPSCEFDAVVMSEVLEHLDDHILNASLREVWRVLKVGGSFIATVPYKENLMASQVVCPNCGNVFHKVGHVQSFDKDSLCKVVKECGFVVVRLSVDAFIDWQKKGAKALIKSVVRKLLAKMGEPIADPHLVLVAKKV